MLNIDIVKEEVYFLLNIDRMFTPELLHILSSLQFNAKKVRKQEGIYIEGVQLKLESFDRDRLY